MVISIPPKIKITTCTTSVHATAESPPHTEYVRAKRPSPIMLILIMLPSPLPIIVSMAFPPKYITVVRLTKTKSEIQKTASIVLRLLLNLILINSGMVYIFFSIKIGRKNLPTTKRVIAAIHS